MTQPSQRKMALTQTELKELLRYEPKTGNFYWLSFRRGKALEGSTAGCVMNTGYIGIKIKSERYVAHRLAWLYMTGAWPEDRIDHIDGDRANNKWKNLREATVSQNVCNSDVRTDNDAGFRGVCWHPKSGRWAVKTQFGDKSYALGYFAIQSDAVKFAEMCRSLLHEGFAREKKP